MPETGVRSDPYPAFLYEVKLDALAVGGFSECSGLQLDTEVQDFAEGGLNSHLWRFPGRTKQSNIVLKRGIVDKGLWTWYYQLTQGDFQPKDGSIVVRDQAGTRVMEWQFRGAFPSKWTGPQLAASQNNVAVETLELAHQGLERVL
jgi:phage tail-like protein